MNLNINETAAALKKRNYDPPVFRNKVSKLINN